MILVRILPLAAAVVSGAALLSQSASSRTICRPDGVCFNTSGTPIAPWQQPAYRGYAYPSPYYHYRRHWRHDDDYYGGWSG